MDSDKPNQSISLGARMLAGLSSVYFKTLRAALKGDDEAIQALFWWAKATLRSGELPSKGLTRFFLRIIEDQNLYAKANKTKGPPKKRGRPSIDDKKSKNSPISGFKFKKFKGYTQSEKNALAVAYLLSEGFLINEAGTKNKESAVEYLSTLTRRSWRSLQTDYYNYKATLIDNPDALEIGKIELMRLKRLHELKKKRTSQ